MVTEFVADTTALIIAVSSMLGVIGSIVVAVAAKFGASKAKDIAVTVGQSLKETDKWVLENEGKLVTIMEVGYNLAPQEAKDRVAQYQELIRKYNGDLRAATEELKKLYGPFSVPEAEALKDAV
jgi:hypothetical protein